MTLQLPATRQPRLIYWRNVGPAVPAQFPLATRTTVTVPRTTRQLLAVTFAFSLHRTHWLRQAENVGTHQGLMYFGWDCAPALYEQRTHARVRLGPNAPILTQHTLLCPPVATLLGAFDGQVDFAGPSGVTLDDTVEATEVGVATIATPSVLASFTGTGEQRITLETAAEDGNYEFDIAPGNCFFGPTQSIIVATQQVTLRVELHAL